MSAAPHGLGRAVWGAIRDSRAALLGAIVLVVLVLACTLTLPYTLGTGPDGAPRFDAQQSDRSFDPPWWWAGGAAEAAATATPPNAWLGTDLLGRDLLVRLLAGGAVSLLIGLLAAAIAVAIGTLYGGLAAWCGGRVDALMMRVVDVLYGLPYVLLVVLLAVASSAALDEYVSRSSARAAWMIAELRQQEPGLSRSGALERLDADPVLRATLLSRALGQPDLQPRRLSAGARSAFDIATLFVAIGGVGWLTMARVVRGQVLSLKERPFIEAARAAGTSAPRIFARHILPNLAGVIVVYATLTVPQAILQESFLSFLGIGVRPPLPSWGNLAADGLEQINPIRSHWWLLVFPCLLLCGTLLALNFVGEALRKAFDPRAR
ncbi:MAG: ABC transporter permease [Phycisphaerales bacterium]